MANPLPVVGGVNYKISVLLNQGLIGWSNQFYFNTPTQSMEGATAAARRLAAALRAVGSSASYIAGIRISELAEPRPVNLIAGSTVPNAGAFTTAAEYPAKGWLVALSEATFTYRRKMFIRGIVTAHNTYSPTNQVSPIPNTTFTQKFNDILNILENDPNNSNGTTQWGRWVIRAWDKVTPTRQEFPIKSITTNTVTGAYQYGTDVPDNFVIGQDYRVTLIRGPGLKGANGPFRLIEKGIPVGGITPLISNRVPRCAGQIMVKQFGKFVLSVRRFYPIAQGQLERIVAKKTGAAFFGTVGRRPNQC